MSQNKSQPPGTFSVGGYARKVNDKGEVVDFELTHISFNDLDPIVQKALAGKFDKPFSSGVTVTGRMTRKPATPEDCPGHVASAKDPKVCARCGIHIDDLRPDDTIA